MWDLPCSHTLCLMIIQGDLPGAHTILSDKYKRRVPHTNWYPEDMTKCWGSKRKKGMVHNADAWQVFRKYWHPYIFLKRGTTHNPAVKWSLKMLGA